MNYAINIDDKIIELISLLYKNSLSNYLIRNVIVSVLLCTPFQFS